MNKKQIDLILANPNGMKDWQVAEIMQARENLLAGMELPDLAVQVIEAGAKLCHFESPTEWECTIQSEDPAVVECVLLILNNAQLVRVKVKV